MWGEATNLMQHFEFIYETLPWSSCSSFRCSQRRLSLKTCPEVAQTSGRDNLHHAAAANHFLALWSYSANYTTQHCETTTLHSHRTSPSGFVEASNVKRRQNLEVDWTNSLSHSSGPIRFVTASLGRGCGHPDLSCYVPQCEIKLLSKSVGCKAKTCCLFCVKLPSSSDETDVTPATSELTSLAAARLEVTALISLLLIFFVSWPFTGVAR